MSRVAVDSSAAALQYGPTDGPRGGHAAASSQVMAAEGTAVETDDLMVTTGGQQVIDLVCRAFLDPGDVVVAEAPTYPGAVPCFNSFQADVVQIEMDDDGMRIDVLEETLARLKRRGPPAEVHLHDPELPEPGRRHDVAGAPPRAGADRRRAGARDPRGQPVRAAALRGRPAADAVLARRRRATSSTSARSRRSSRPACGSAGPPRPAPILERLNLGKQAADLCSSPLNQYFVAAYFEHRDWRTYLAQLRAIYRRRRDAMLAALEEFLPREATWTRPQGGLFIWATLPDYIDTTDLLARALREHVAFVPGRAAYLDGRGGSEMRLNFSGVGEDDIREGVRRIGKVVSEQVALYGTLTGAKPRAASRPRSRCLRRASCRCGGGRPREGRGPQGRHVAGADGLAALRRAGRGRAGAPRPRGARRSTSAPTSSTACRPSARTSRSSRCTAAAARTAPSRSCWSSSACPYTASRPGACIRCMDKVVAKHALRDAGIPTPDFYAFSQAAFEDLGAAQRAAGDRGAPGLPDRRQARRPGLGARDQVRAHARPTCRAPWWPRSPTTRRCCSSATSTGATSRWPVLDAPTGPEALPVVEAIPPTEDFYDFEARYEIGPTRFVCPADLSPEITLRAQELALATWKTLGCSGFARVDLMLDGES